MPFTFSHPALVLPLTYLPRHWFSLTGLVIGSLTPDFEYFLRMRIRSDYSHTIVGLLWFDLPLGLVLAFIFHNIVRNSLVDNMPIILKSRCFAFKQFDWNRYFRKNWLIVIISVLIGALSHVLWDSFTHDDGYFVRRFPELATSISLLGIQVPIVKILQHVSSFIGAIVIAFAIYKLPVQKENLPSARLMYWLLLLGLMLFIVALRFLSGLQFQQYGNVIVSAIAAGLIAFIIVPLVIETKSD